MTLKKFNFNVISEDKFSRCGQIFTSHGLIDTPAFMPVGTQATVKAVFINDIIKTGSEIILSNTYHLMLRPGLERIESVGGLHKFMNCPLPILTDSGGFQVMSLSKLNKIDREKGAIFKSHIDGKKFILSPEESIRVQKGLNSDIVMVMDECPKKTNDYKSIEKSMNLSTYWADRSKKAFGVNPHKALFGIVQGGLFKDLRIKSLNSLTRIGFDGYAIGGLAVGETQSEMFSVLDDIKNYKNDNQPLDTNCKNLNLNKYSKNYLNHLFNTNEILASMLLTLHNINFYQELMSKIRDNIKKGTFNEFHDLYISKL
jgi:queuine tRNA-ribosyltransferase